MANVKIEESWAKVLSCEFEKEYFAHIKERYYNAIKKSTILPPPKLIFNAFNNVAFNDVKVVILGQDPYHGIENGIPQAHGLSFSVPNGVQPPPSLRNIFKEIKRDLGIDMNDNIGDLTPWAKQGVLLLNSILSVEYKKPLSHAHFGWENLTDKVIEILSNDKENIVFMLWGKWAKNKKTLIDTNKHYVLEAPHPSPLARGFIGCGHFRECNKILVNNGISSIDWKI